MDTTAVFAPITKSYEQDDGSLMVEGIITDSSLDLDQQRCDPAWLKKAVPQWFSVGNLREQHDAHRAVGKAVEHQDLGDAGHFIRGRVVDSEAVKKVKAGVFTGFSIGIKGPRITKSADAPGGVIADGRIIEVSLVDVPCNGNATLTVCKAAKPGMSIKAADFDSDRMLVRVEELVETSPDVEKASEMTVTLADAVPAEQVEKLAEKLDQTIEKVTDTDHLDAPAPGQICADCNSEGHLNCGVVKSMTGCGCCDQCTAPAAKSIDVDVEKTVEDILAKVDNGLGDDESSDISGAEQAIAIIAELIQSEAKLLATAPAQGCDIDLLMQAVHALCWFKKREEAEQGGLNPALVGLAAEPDAEKADKEPYGDVEYADPGYQKDGKKRYPIDTEAHVRAALSYIGQSRNASEYSSDQLSKIKARIMAAAKKFGIDAEKAVDAAETKTTEAEVEEKTAEVEKAAVAEPVDIEQAIANAIEKAFSELEKSDNPIRKTFTDIIEASTKPAAEALTDVSARLEKVEAMAVPGGPALRRTEVERVQSRKNDLQAEVMRYKALASNSEDHVLRKGYAQKAAALEAEIKAL